jgi:hypothetical protein
MEAIMSEVITLQALIEKVKSDLFSSYVNSQQSGKLIYPIFFVDQVELEVQVSLQHDTEAGIKITIPQVVEGSLGAFQGKGSYHTLKIKLSPILSREELRGLIDQDDRLLAGIRQATQLALRKGNQLPGEE